MCGTSTRRHPDPAARAARSDRLSFNERVYAVVRRIPPGRIASYGQVAVLAGSPGAARQVGWALAGLAEGHDVPWHRVLNATGRISARGEPAWEAVQRAMLEAEGVEFDATDRTDLDRFGWVAEEEGNREWGIGNGVQL